jgi:signal transduction histidine kinase
MPSQIPRTYDLRTENVWELIDDTFADMFRTDMQTMAVKGESPTDASVIVEVVLEEAPLRDAMWDYAKRTLLLGLFISIATAGMVYGTLQWLAVHPLRRLTENMIAFREAPEDPHRVIQATGRHDEVGVAERALADMEQDVRAALLQKERLAGVGTAVTKISHDLKNILATAMLESDRLEAVSDPEVRRITAGLVRAIDRAVTLSASTLRFAREGLPEVKLRAMTCAELMEEIARIVAEMPSKLELERGTVEDFTFDGDPELLRRAFENLLRNAAEAGATGITVNAHNGTDHPYVSIADNGPGLSPKALQNLFVPFAGTTRASGSGLGLPIARELLRVQGGDVVLEKSSREGACFVVRLPV